MTAEHTATSGDGAVFSLAAGAQSGVIALSGEIDFSVTPEARRQLLALLDQGTGDVVLDLSRLEYIDSSGLAMLIEARKILLTKKRSIRISGVSDQVRKLFNLTQIGELFGL